MLIRNRHQRSGQISVILILFIAILLSIFAVIVNIGKLSQNKVSATIAVDGSAALMASMFASFAEAQYHGTIMGGGDHDEDWSLSRRETSNIWTYIASLVIAIVGLILVCTVFGSGLGAVLIAVAAVVLSLATVVLQFAVVQPAMQGAWNRMFRNLSTQEQFREQGIQSLFSASAQDPVLIDDIADYDMDGYLKGDGTLEGEADQVGRFSVLYTKRAEFLSKKIISRVGPVKDFLKALAELLYDQLSIINPGTGYKIFPWDPYWDITPDGFGLYDKDFTGCPSGGYFKNECETSWCSSTTMMPQLCPPNGTPWTLIYDWNWEDPTNSFMSFREKIGRDDENKDIFFTPVSTNPQAAGASAQNLATAEWLGEDATGLYRLLWDLDRVDLSVINGLGSGNHQGCAWCGSGSGAGQSFNYCPSPFSGFTLPQPQACNANNPHYQSSPNGLRDCWCLKTNTDPTQATPSQIAENTCYVHIASSFRWKKGHNAYCSVDVPYDICSGKNCASTCVNQNNNSACCLDDSQCSSSCLPSWDCGQDGLGNSVANQALWREDTLDYLRYGPSSVDTFITEVKNLFFKGPEALAGGQASVLEQFVKWIKTSGELTQWTNMFTAIKQQLVSLQAGTFASGSFVCPGSNPANVATCLNSTITAIQNCMDASYCTNNITACSNLANQLGLYFAEPASGAVAPYAGQATGCTAFTANYVFQHELANWKKKLEHRRDYLVNAYNRTQAAIASLDVAKQKVESFLSDPRVQAIRDMFSSSGQALVQDGGTVVYAWQDEAKSGQAAFSGRWHAVRAEAFIPTLCGGKCGRTTCERQSDATNGTQCAEPYMPWVKNWKHDLGTRFWYSLIDYESESGAKKGKCGKNNGGGYSNKESYKDVAKCFKGGLVRASIVRYDEGKNFLSWATGLQFWQPKFFNPNVTSTDPHNALNVTCSAVIGSSETPDGGCSYGIRDVPSGSSAFILNCKSSFNQACWDEVHELLKTGTQAKSCAEYFARHGSTLYRSSRFGVKFVPCPW